MNSTSLPYPLNNRPPQPPQPSAAAVAAFPQEPQLPVYTIAASKMGTPETDTTSPTALPTSWTPSTNPRSCTTCRKRKVGCDKRQPCSNCTKAGIECRFPPPGRAPRRSKKPPDTELLARLRRLEGVVQSLGKGANGEDLPSDAQPNTEDGKGAVSGEGRKSGLNRQDDKFPSTKTRSTGSLQDTGVELELGRLVVDEGTSRSRYVSNGFWTALSEQVSFINSASSLGRFDDCPIALLGLQSWGLGKRRAWLTATQLGLEIRLTLGLCTGGGNARYP